jgi:uncharacterized protein
MKVVITGGSGQIGRILSRALSANGDDVIVVSRHDAHLPGRWVRWDGPSLGEWTDALEGCDAIINLAGRSVNCRYGAKNRREIMDSRVQTARLVHSALRACKTPPVVWLQAATATIYAHRLDAPNDERIGIIGGDEAGAPDTWRFSINVAKAWEAAVTEAEPLPKTRIVIMRSAMTMSPDRGGIFATLLGLVRFGLGGRAGDGRQYVSWIHEEDFVRAIRRFIEDERFAGIVNVCAPNPVPNAEFMRELRRAWGVSFGLPASKWMLEIGAIFLRTETELILKSRRVIPGRLLESGFEFKFANWRDAAVDLCRKYRALRN